MRTLKVVSLMLLVTSGLVFGATALTSFGVNGGDKSDQFANHPDAGLSDIARQEQYGAARNEFEGRYLQWLSEFLASGTDPWPLPRVEIQDRFVEGAQSLQAAAIRADVIGIGVVEAVRFEPYGARTQFRLTDALKGNSGTYTIAQTGGPFPNHDWESGQLQIAPNDPLMRPGTRALLFLQRDTGPDVYHVQSYTGHYEITDGRVRALPLNDFAEAIDGKSETEALDLTSQALAAIGSE
ncbi:MAG TPA: hypothetical protein VLS25_00275 [Dehalococcoidia bacterium]|nr:hypothetical protein [Dehalococcoidia bacterium]